MISKSKRISSNKGFVDISLSFKRNPNTNDIILIKDEDAIKKAILNLIFTNKGERFFAPNVGSSIQKYLFDLALTENTIGLENTIREVLENYEPRIRIRSIESVIDDASNECTVTTTYTIVGSENTPQNLKFVLQSSRV